MMRTLADEILYGTASNVEQALKKVEHANFIDEYGFTPLIEAAIINDPHKSEIILKSGADVNWPDLTGSTALHWAVENNNPQLCQLLLSYKADPNSYTAASQPVLVKTLLRKQHPLKNLLIKHGALVNFAQDFINTKLLGHLFELIHSVDIVDHEGYFTEVDFEGFFLESTLELIIHSLADFKNNYAARPLRNTFDKLETIINALNTAAKLIGHQSHLIDYQENQGQINQLLSQDPLIIPISQEGHALTLLRHGNLFSVCDRMPQSNKRDPIVIYYMNRPSRLTAEWLCELIYERQELDIFHKIFPHELGLHPVASLPIPPQLSGNCTWANVEACIPALFLMLSMNDSQSNQDNPRDLAMNLFRDWRHWEQDRSLIYCIQDFHISSPARKASKAAILGAILFQSCLMNDKKSEERAVKILPILKTKGYEYVLENYIEVYHHRKKTPAGDQLLKLLDTYQRLHAL